jgi:tetratricopeptide (TPR) repeat protein
VQYRIETNDDGSQTVWVGELEVRQRMCWAVGYTLRPGKSYLECHVRIVNRTPLVQTMLCFANVAVSVNTNYQVIFPPDTQHVTYHHKSSFTTWPIATTFYNGIDFTRGVDVSWYSNHVSANSMFAWNYSDDFFAGYDHGKQAGTMSIADHHIIPGKKFWTWGNGPRGRMWDHILTDDDGPYIELMVGAFSDNQPDYSWLQPFEAKSFDMFWYPFRDIDGVKKANLDAAVNLDVQSNGLARVGFCTTSDHPTATALLKAGDQVLMQEQIAINPGKPFVKEIPVPPGTDEHDLRASLLVDGRELVSYSPVKLAPEPMPEAVKPPLPPDQIKTVEELYLAGLRLEQFFDTSDPVPYWEEALRRDPGDIRVNTALGINYLKKARYADAEKLLRKALERDTANYTTPKDAEPYYYLGVALEAQGKTDEAFDNFYKSTWNSAWRDAGYFAIAQIACQRGDFDDALDYANRSLDANALNIRAATLKAAILRHQYDWRKALRVVQDASEKIDPLDVGALAERWLDEVDDNYENAPSQPRDEAAFVSTLKNHPAAGLEAAVQYADAGLWADGTSVLQQLVAAAPDQSRVTPMAYYYLGWFAQKQGQSQKALDYFKLAAQMPANDLVFPFQFEGIQALEAAMTANPQDAHAPYLLGDLLFDSQPARATKLWEQSAALDPSFTIVHRNLAVAYSHQDGNDSTSNAIAQLEQAVSNGDTYADHFYELDQLYETTGVAPEKRLALLEQNQSTVVKRDDATARLVSLKIFAGKYDEAIALMQNRVFSIWEGGSSMHLDVSWTDAHLLRGREHLAAKQFPEALADFNAALQYPIGLRIEQGDGPHPRQAEVSWFIGLACEGMGDLDRAKQAWNTAVSTSLPTGGGRRGGRGGRGGSSGADRGVQRYYQALALQKLGQASRGETIFHELASTSTGALEQADADANAAPPIPSAGNRQPRSDREASAYYLIGLGHLGLNETDAARNEFTLALAARPDYLAAKISLATIQ